MAIDDEPLPRLQGEPLFTTSIPPGTRIYRSHHLARSPLFFGKGPRFRFDDPRGEYGVLYAAAEPSGAFVETFLRFPTPTFLSREDLGLRGCAVIEVTRRLQLVPLHSEHLVRLRATAEIAHGASYRLPQTWSRAIYEHSATYDGIEYRSRHDDSQLCYAVFDRADDSLNIIAGSTSWTADSLRLRDLLDRYKVEIA